MGTLENKLFILNSITDFPCGIIIIMENYLLKEHLPIKIWVCYNVFPLVTFFTKPAIYKIPKYVFVCINRLKTNQNDSFWNSGNILLV